MFKQENPNECILTILTIMLASEMTDIPVEKVSHDHIRDAAALVKSNITTVMGMFGKPII